MRWLLRQRLAGLCIIALLPLATWAQSAHDLARDIAPTGTLRAVINLGNPILARLDAVSGQPVGLSVDLAQALAEQLHLPLTLVPVSSAGQSVDLVTQGLADLGFFAIDPVRGQGITFSPAYVWIEGSYLVKNNAPLTRNEQVDQASHQVVVGLGSAYDLFLTRELKHATLVRAPTSPQVVSVFLQGDYTVAAGVKQQLEFDAQQNPGLRLLPGRFMVIEQAMGLPRQRSPIAHTGLARFVEEMKTNGFIQARLKHHRIDGATVAH